MSSARDEVLRRVRAATREAAAPPEVPRTYRRAGKLDPEKRLALLGERLADYGTVVHRVGRDELPAELARALRELEAERVGIPAALPADWRPAGVELIEDDALSPHQLDRLDAVLTGCTLAIAETGTIVLGGTPRDGRRALTLVPDVHVCVLRAEDVVELVPEAIAALAETVRQRRPITFVSGPSATSDIELDRVEGVHGPRTLVVFVLT